MQANRANDLYARKSSEKIKSPLDEEDICNILIPRTIKSSVKNLPVMVTAAVPKRDGIHYKVCSKHGHIISTFSRHVGNSTISWMQLYNRLLCGSKMFVQSSQNLLHNSMP